jgi:hypothetical protein
MIKISPQPGDNTAYIQQKINEANAPGPNRGEIVYFGLNSQKWLVKCL